MAIAHVNSQSADVTCPAGAASVATTVNAGGASDADKYTIAQVGFRDSNAHASASMTLNSVSMSALGAQLSGNGAAQRIFGLATAAADLSSVSLSAGFTGGVGTQTGVLSHQTYSGVDQSSSTDGYNPNSGSSGGATLAVSSAVGDVAAWFALFRGFSGDSVNVGSSSYTERVDNLSGTGGALVVVGGGEAAGAATVNFSASLSGGASNGWAAQGINLNVAAGGGGGGSSKRLIGGNLINRSIVLRGRLAA